MRRKAKSSLTMWEASYAHPAVPVSQKWTMAVLGAVVGLIVAIERWGWPWGGV